MNILVFGATGRTGKRIVQQACSASHQVRAFVRTEGSLTPHANLQVIVGDLNNEKEITLAVQGCDAVIVVLGHRSKQKELFIGDAIQRIAGCMKQVGVTRIIALTGAGVFQPGDTPGLPDKVITFLLKKLDPLRIADGEATAEALQQSGLDWTLVRAPLLIDADPTGNYHLTPVGKGGMKVTCGDVADFMIKECEAGKWIGKSPLISN